MVQQTIIRGTAAAVAAAVLDIVVLLVARAAGASMMVPVPLVDESQGMPVAIVAVVAVGAIVGATVIALVLAARMPSGAQRTFTIVVIAAGVLSCIPVLVLAPDLPTAVALVLMHLITAAVALVALVPATRRDRLDV
jgi:hypothetical protein